MRLVYRHPPHPETQLDTRVVSLPDILCTQVQDTLIGAKQTAIRSVLTHVHTQLKERTKEWLTCICSIIACLHAAICISSEEALILMITLGGYKFYFADPLVYRSSKMQPGDRNRDC